MNGTDIILIGTAASLAAGLATALGGLAVFCIRRLPAKWEDVLLNMAAGIMLAASFFSLLLPAVAQGVIQFGGKAAGAGVVIAGLLLGALVLRLVNRLVPHEHFLGGPEGPQTKALDRIWLFVIAVAIHNFPEGTAVGVGFADGDVGNGIALATGIALQNVPEGLAVAVSLLAAGYSRARAASVAALTGLVEPVGALFGTAALWAASGLMPMILGFAAGAMLFVINDEIIPETHKRGFENAVTFALMGGFAMMMFLDVVLG